MQLGEKTGSYYTTEKYTNTQSGQMANPIVKKNYTKNKTFQYNSTNLTKSKYFNKKINHSIIW
jgi:hypothetical protein